MASAIADVAAARRDYMDVLTANTLFYGDNLDILRHSIKDE